MTAAAQTYTVTAKTFKVGDVIRDADGQPAVVFHVDTDGQPVIICQTAGANRGRLIAPPPQLSLVMDKAAAEQAKEIGRQEWPRYRREQRAGSSRPAPAVPVPAVLAASEPDIPPALRNLKHKPTGEQAGIIDAYLRGICLVINAFAGSGKTTILKMLALANPLKAITYLAYNATAKDDARASFPRNASCMTTHGLAFMPMIHMASRVGGGKYIKGHELARLMNIHGPHRISGAKMLAPGQVARIVRETIRKFCFSADETITGRHVPGDLNGFTPEEIAALRQFVPAIAWRVWTEDITTEHGVVPMDHDYYLKAFALTHPELPGDVILLDEAQDSNACVSAMILEQMTRYGKQVVMTGDTYQQIYAWRGATNAMITFAEQPGVLVLNLTQSFRFGPEIARWANKALRILGCTTTLKGFDKIDSRVGEIPGHPDAVICRTNAEAMQQAIDWIGKGLRVAFPKGAGEFAAFVRGARDIKAGRAAEHEDLMIFSTWQQVQDYAETEADGENLQKWVELVDEVGVDELLATLEQIGNVAKGCEYDIVITTGHGAKGGEWDTVEICNDFREPKRDPADLGQPEIPAEQARLIYVAITRGKDVLDPHGITWIDKYDPARGVAA